MQTGLKNERCRGNDCAGPHHVYKRRLPVFVVHPDSSVPISQTCLETPPDIPQKLHPIVVLIDIYRVRACNQCSPVLIRSWDDSPRANSYLPKTTRSHDVFVVRFLRLKARLLSACLWGSIYVHS